MKFKVGDKVKVVANNYRPDDNYIGEQGEVKCIFPKDYVFPYSVLLDNGDEVFFQEVELTFLDEEVKEADGQKSLDGVDLTYILEPIKRFAYIQLYDAVMFLKCHDDVSVAVGEMLERAINYLNKKGLI